MKTYKVTHSNNIISYIQACDCYIIDGTLLKFVDGANKTIVQYTIWREVTGLTDDKPIKQINSDGYGLMTYSLENINML